MGEKVDELEQFCSSSDKHFCRLCLNMQCKKYLLKCPFAYESAAKSIWHLPYEISAVFLPLFFFLFPFTGTCILNKNKNLGSHYFSSRRSREQVGLKKCFHLGVRDHFLTAQSHKIKKVSAKKLLISRLLIGHHTLVWLPLVSISYPRGW